MYQISDTIIFLCILINKYSGSQITGGNEKPYFWKEKANFLNKYQIQKNPRFPFSVS